MLESIRALAADVDLIGYHPFYQCDPDEPRFRGYIADVRAFAGYCAAHGFRGELLASEWNYAANYPAPTPPNWWGDWTCSEIAKAKIVAQLSVAHTALGVGSFFCETWSNYYPLDLTLLRRGTAADPITPQQPQAAYYAMRNLAGALDGLQPAAFPVTVTGAEVVALPLIGAVALWLPGRPVDVHPGTPVTVTLDGTHHATAYDPLNGVEQALRVEHEGGQTVIPGLLVRDCPVLVRVT